MLQPLTGGLTPLGVGRLAGSYASKVLATAPANLLAYWKLDELSGSVAHDSSGNGRHGTYQNGVTLNGATFEDGSPAASFDGINDYVDVYSSSLASAFNGSEGTLLVWVRSSALGLTGRHDAFRIAGASTSRVTLIKGTPASSVTESYLAGGVTNNVSLPYDGTDWFQSIISWSKSADAVKVYLNGSLVGSATGLGSWVGELDLASVVLGAVNTSGTFSWDGSLAHAALWDTALNTTQIAHLALV